MLYHTKNRHGGDIYSRKIELDYSANTNPFGTPNGVIQAIKDSLYELHHYPDPYCRELVQAIAEYESVSQDYIICGNGAAELIYSYCEAVRPVRAVELAPTFSEYSLGLGKVSCMVRRYELKKENGFDLDEDFLEFLKKYSPEVVFLCNPNNPTGRLISKEMMEEVLMYCKKEGIRLFVDECFLDLTEGEGLRSCLEKFPCLFILKAFTKSYGMAGLRLGYGMTADMNLLERMSGTVQPWNVSYVAQKAGVAALKEREFLEKTKALVKEERRWLKAELEKEGFWVSDSQTNFLLFQTELSLQDALAERGIAIRNCDNYKGLTEGWYRIAVRKHEENMRFMGAVHQICRKEKECQTI